VQSRDLLAESHQLPTHESERLLAAATGRARSQVIVGFDVSHAESVKFRSFVRRRLADEPLQYIEGSVPFGQITVMVDDRVLVPRPETEYLLELLMHLPKEPSVIVDLCTGSGNLALALKAEFPDAVVYATDLSEDAIDVARGNAELNRLEINNLHGDLFEPLPSSLEGSVDLLVANPPYLGEGEIDDLPADVLQEPRGALVAGRDGDEVIERIGSGASTWMAPGGTIACEVSEFLADAVAGYFGSVEMRVVKDLAGKDRYVVGRFPVD